MGPWCPADLEIPRRERQCPMRVGTRLQPELRRVVGEGLGMPREEFVVARCRPGAPLTGLLHTADLAQDAGKLCRVIGVVGGDCQRAQPGDRRVGLAQRSLDLGQMALRRSVVGQAAMRGAEPTARARRSPWASHIRARRKSNCATGNGETPR